MCCSEKKKYPSNFRGDAVGCARECVLATGTTAWSHLFGQAGLSSASCSKLVDIDQSAVEKVGGPWPNFFDSAINGRCQQICLCHINASGFVALRISQVGESLTDLMKSNQ